MSENNLINIDDIAHILWNADTEYDAKQIANQIIPKLLDQAIIKELKTMWNATQEDIIPLGTRQSEEADYIQQRLKELEK